MIEISKIDWDAIMATKATFGKGWGINVVCQNCGNRQLARLQRGAKIALMPCAKCGQTKLKRARIDDQGKLLNDPLASS
jgi:predicted RNA-binding Zn-ribbon protein involved in translation (DUF1610 family)